jgi:ABC-2 type transport system ATP-binding protein
MMNAEGLVKIYRTRKTEVRALDGLDLEVEEGPVPGLLGPNGAAETTADAAGLASAVRNMSR